jgi:hypothetical protein
MSILQLSNVRPDWEDLVSQLQSALDGEDAWTDLLTSSTGQTLIDFIAAVGAYDQFSIESAVQEVFPLTAKNASSVYAISQMLGVRLNRKLPAEMTVDISAPSNVSIPAYSQFTGGGSYFYNRDAVNVTSTPQEITLHQGIVVTKRLNGLGTDFQAFITQESNFSVSDQDLLVFLNSALIDVTQAGLWEKKSQAGAQDLTLNEFYATKPLPNDVIDIIYVVTSGSDGNNLSMNTKPLAYDNDDSVVVVATADPSGGADQNPPFVYKTIAAPLFGTFSSAVTKAQCQSQLLQYPGVVDGLTLAQRETNPLALRRMNLIEAYLITSSVWDTEEEDGFVEWFQDRILYSPVVLLKTPTENVVNISAEIYCLNSVTLAQAKQDAEAALTALLEPKAGVINRNLYRSDIIKTIMESNNQIEFVVLTTPSSDVTIQRTKVGYPEATSVAGGSLVPGTIYTYGIGYTSSLGGTVAPSNFRTLPAGSGHGSIQLSWPAVPNASTYRVYGREYGGTLGLLTTTAGLTYTDTGGDAVTPPVPDEDTMNLYYNILGTLTITPYYTARQPLVTT